VSIRLAETDDQIQRCFPVMVQLRPKLNGDEFVSRVRRQMAESGYQLAFIETGGHVVANAGFRISECLSAGKYLYVDDLIVDENTRSNGYGQQLTDWLINYARTHHCDEFRLDSGVQRFAAHRFYFRQRMVISAYHFTLPL
jgi:GNAT superfamily N-acetyltransferase